jgi:hypothetical protein
VELPDESFLCNAKPKAALQVGAFKNSLRTRSSLPTSGSCLVRREGQAREFSSGSCRLVLQSAKMAQWENLLRYFLL